MRVPELAAAIPPAIAALDNLLVALAIIIAAVAILLNPFLADRPSARFPNIVQDAVIVVLAFLVTTFVLRDTGIVAASAASAVVVGFALQDTLGNAIAGLAIQIEKPFRVGHWIRVGEHVGVVEEITWRATKLRTRAGAFVIVPNSVISKEAIVNFNEPVRPVRFSLDIGATYAKGPNEVREALFEAVQRSSHALLDAEAGRPPGRLRQLGDRLPREVLGRRVRRGGRRARRGAHRRSTTASRGTASRSRIRSRSSTRATRGRRRCPRTPSPACSPASISSRRSTTTPAPSWRRGRRSACSAPAR